MSIRLLLMSYDFPDLSYNKTFMISLYKLADEENNIIINKRTQSEHYYYLLIHRLHWPDNIINV